MLLDTDDCAIECVLSIPLPGISTNGPTIRKTKANAGNIKCGSNPTNWRRMDLGGLNANTLKARKRRLLVTTKMELKAIAPAANIGLSKPKAAIGMSAIL